MDGSIQRIGVYVADIGGHAGRALGRGATTRRLAQPGPQSQNADWTIWCPKDYVLA